MTYLLWMAVSAALSGPVPVDPEGATDGGVEAVGLNLPSLDWANDPPAGESAGEDAMVPADRMQFHVPDPELDRQLSLDLQAKAQRDGDKTTAAQVTRILERVETIRRTNQVRLPLEEVLRRTLEKSYAIQVLSYNPAIDTTRVVEAEAAFDATFFTNITKNNIDRPSDNALTSTDLDLFTSSYGIRKLLPTGMSVRASYDLSRTKSAISFQEINPAYTSNLILEMRQPLLRNFGIDHNRSLILISRNDRRISDHAFSRQIRDTLRQTEEFYWRLAQARRDVVISARLLADFETIYDYLSARKEFDITPVQLAATKANLEQSKADFVRRRAAVFDAEDRLTAAMNADEYNLADDIEMIPTNVPKLQRIVIDRLAEVQTALDHRPEIKEQELRVANAKLAVGRAKNGELPRFDVTFRPTYDGLAGNADGSFDEMTRSNFIEYYIGVEFEAPIGNRGPRAAHQRSLLQHSQAVASLRKIFEDVILDVNLSARAVTTSYDQIRPSFEAAEAREREVALAVARAERKDYSTLTSELGARQSLAGARRAMLAAMVDYNVAIIDLERAKGTLLSYNNVVIPDSGN